MNLRELRARVEELVGLADAHDGTDPGEIDGLLNEAYHEVAGLYDWTWLRQDQTVAVVDGTTTYDLTAPVVYAEQVRLSTGGTLEPMSGYELDAIHDEDRRPDGKPARYCWRDPDTLEVYPTPDGAYTLTVRGIVTVTSLSAESDEPIFAEEFHPALAYMAAASLTNAVDKEQSGRHGARADAIVQRMWRRYQVDHDRTPMVMGGRRTHRALERRLNGGR